IIGLAAALDLAQLGRHEEAKRLQNLQQDFFKLLEKQIPSAQLNGSKKYSLPNNIHLTIPGRDNERLLIQLDEAGIMAAAGSACSASNEEPSHVLRAIGLTDSEARASLRLTMGRSTDEAAVKRCLQVLTEVLL
ncbi:MAG TPA: aminotransferase class V-fold PLP-dependent enzyme, partial [Candidatus Dormibacteraeota bacterium]|nr:aminotransferase class V-fold PLP-dependent enzyme [Candidatus Dormibacteraeota bacterium]